MNRLFLLLFGMVTFVAHAQVPDYVPTEGLVDWWPLDGNATNFAGDNDGEIEGCLPAENRFGEASKALFFDGQNDRVSLDTFFGGEQMASVSYSLWFNSNGSPNPQFLSGKEGFWRTIYIRLTSANDIRFGGTSQGVYFGVTSDEQVFTLGTWHHLVVTFEDAVITLFLDGNQIAQGSSAANLLEYQFYAAGNSTATNYFGATHPVSPGLCHFFSGKMDDFGLWNRALTEEEILILYNAELPIPGCTDPTACNYDEEATEDDGSCQFAPDFVGNDTIILTCPGTSIQFPNELGQGDPYLFNSGSPNPWPAGSLEAGGAIPLGVFGTPSNFSLAFSVNPSPEQNGHSIMFDASHGGSSNWVLQNLGDGWRFLGHEIPLTAGVWQDVLITYSGCDVNFYVDGELTTQVTHCINYSGNPSWYMGNWPEGGRRFTGSIDDVLYSHEVLTSEAVTMGADAPGAVQFFAFDEGEGPDTMEQISMASSPLNGWAWEVQATSDGTIAWDGVDDIEMLTFGQDTTLTYVWSNDFCEASGAVTVVIITNLGCTDSDACNYSPDVECDDGSCIYPALGLADCDMGGAMCGEGTVWDATLQACVSFDDCPSDLNENGFVDVTDLLLILADFGSNCPTESSAWSCGDPYNYQGYYYATVEIGESCWFQENLRASFYANNFPIPYVQDDAIWSTTEDGALCDYGLDANNGAVYGRLYNAHAVAHPSGLCPSGWHVSSLEDWSELDNLFGGFDLAGAACKASPSDTPPWDGTNESGLTALPGGRRYQNGTFNGFGGDGFWWMGSTNPEGLPLYRMLYYCDCMHQGTYDAQTGFSVRCVKD